VVRRLARRARPAAPEGLPHQAASSHLPEKTAGRGSCKKTPGLGTVAEICRAWAEAFTPDSTEARVAKQLAAASANLRPGQLHELVPIGLVETWRRNLKPSTAYGQTMALRKLLRRFRDIGAPDLAGKLPRVRAPEPRSVTATPQEIERLTAAAPAHMKLFLYLCHQLALRFTEAWQLTPADYDHERQTIRVRTKGNKTRNLPVTPEIKALLDTAAPYDNPTTRYLSLLSGRTMQQETIRKQFKALVKSTGANPQLNPHDLRRTTANAAYALTKDLRVVQQLLGHTRFASTAWYMAPLQPEDLADVLDKLRHQQKGETVQ
jgi:integrase